MPAQSPLENTLPVFTAPQQQIVFYADDPSTHKQVLTVYNPYDFSVRFRISCTDCTKYAVSTASQGSIRSNHSINLVIHHKAVTPSNIGVTDTVRIQLFSDCQIRASGKKEISVTLLESTPSERSAVSLESERFQQLETESAAHGNLRQHPLSQERNGNQMIIMGIAAIFCLLVLVLPNAAETSSFFPDFFYKPSHLEKILIGFILGMITVLFFRT